MSDLAVQSLSPAKFIDEWERQPGEPPKAWQAFVLFRDMGEDRGVWAVRDRAGFPTSHKQLMRWAERHRWIERAAAYDLMLDRRRQKAYIEEVEAQARRQVEIGQVLQGVGLDFIKQRLDTPEKVAAELSPSGALRYIDKGVSLERQGLRVDDKDAVTAAETGPSVLDAQTQADVFDTIDRMASNMDEVRKLMESRSTVIDIVGEDVDIEDAELVEDAELAEEPQDDVAAP